MLNGNLSAVDVANSVTSLALIEMLVTKGVLSNDDVLYIARNARSKVSGQDGEVSIAEVLKMYFPGAGL